MPKSDGLVERHNRTIAQMINVSLQESPDGPQDKIYEDWDLKLPLIMMAYRSTEHESTGETPNMLMTGRQMILPVDITTSDSGHDKFMSSSEYVSQLERDMKLCFKRVRDSTEKSAVRQKKYYDRKHYLNTYQKGDLVLMKTAVRQPRIGKFEDRFTGPYAVLMKLSDLHYRIQESAASRPLIVHHDRLKPYFARTEEESDTSWIEQQIVRPRVGLHKRQQVEQPVIVVPKKVYDIPHPINTANMEENEVSSERKTIKVTMQLEPMEVIQEISESLENRMEEMTISEETSAPMDVQRSGDRQEESLLGEGQQSAVPDEVHELNEESEELLGAVGGCPSVDTQNSFQSTGIRKRSKPVRFSDYEC